MCMPQKYALYDNEFMGKRCRCEMSADSRSMDMLTVRKQAASTNSSIYLLCNGYYYVTLQPI